MEHFALDTLPNPNLATFMIVQLIVSGVTIASGVAAANHAAGENKAGRDTYNSQQNSAARNASETQRNQETVPKIRAQLTVNGKNSETGVTAVKIVVVVGKHDREL